METPFSSLENLVGKKVWIDKGAPHAAKGVLLAAKPDHIVLKTDDEGVVYMQTFHIRRVEGENDQGRTEENNDQDRTEEDNDREQPAATENTPEYADYPDFRELLKSMRYRMICVDQGGKEKLQGVLTDVYEDRLLLVRNHEVSAVFTFHIRRIYFPLRQEKKDSGGGTKESESKESGSKEKKAAVKSLHKAAAEGDGMVPLKPQNRPAPWLSGKGIRIKRRFVS